MRDNEYATIIQILLHQNSALHALSHAVADISRHLVPGSMTPAETAAVLARLTTHAVALEKIATAPDVPVPTS